MPHRIAPLLALLALALAGCGGGDGDTGVGLPSLEIRTATGGPEPDADGYTVSVDGGAPQPIGPTDTVVVDPLEPGPHGVALAGLAANCAVTGANPAAATVVENATAVVDFAVTCAPSSGTLVVTTATTGSGTDPDGYQVSVDGAPGLPIGAAATLTIPGLAAGPHSVALAGAAEGCVVQDPNPATVEVPAGGTAPVGFGVVCTAPPVTGRIAFTTNAVGLLGIIVVNPDGTGFVNLTPDGSAEQDPAWSPDGRRLLFLGDGDLQVMNADGTGREPLSSDRAIAEYRWSPDGARIAFSQIEIVGQNVITTLWVMDADGSDPAPLASEASAPTWSPDSRQIAYVSSADQIHVRIIGADGSADRRLTDESADAFQPAWSPVADEILYRTLVSAEIMLIPAAGGTPVNLTLGQGSDDAPVWSPDGARIAFNTAPPNQPLESEIAVMNRDGSGRTPLTDRPGFDFDPDWSPDGRKIVFVRSEEDDSDSEVVAMNSDGSDPVNLSNRPDSYETAPDWSGSDGALVAARGRMAAGSTVAERWRNTVHRLPYTSPRP